MCLGIPMQIDKLQEPSMALVSVQGVQRQVSTILVEHEDLQKGDWLMIHIGFAIGKIDETEAQETLTLLQEAQQLQIQEENHEQ